MTETTMAWETYPNAMTTYHVGPLDGEASLLIGIKITSVESSPNDQTKEEAYYDGDGTLETTVTGSKYSYAISGYRAYGDPAQDFIAGLKYKKGNGRKVNFMITQPDGTTETGQATVSEIIDGGGVASDEATFSCTITFDKEPVIGTGTPKSADNTDPAGA